MTLNRVRSPRPSHGALSEPRERRRQSTINQRVLFMCVCCLSDLKLDRGLPSRGRDEGTEEAVGTMGTIHDRGDVLLRG